MLFLGIYDPTGERDPEPFLNYAKGRIPVETNTLMMMITYLIKYFSSTKWTLHEHKKKSYLLHVNTTILSSLCGKW